MGIGRDLRKSRDSMANRPGQENRPFAENRVATPIGDRAKPVKAGQSRNSQVLSVVAHER
jgi:argininosuccinate lyase